MIESAGNIVIIGNGNGFLAPWLAASLCARGYPAIALEDGRYSDEALASSSPAAFVVDLLVARRDDFALLRRLRSDPFLSAVPVLVSSPGTVVDGELLEHQLRALGARPLLAPHDLDTLLGELGSPPAKVA